jgi:hypothetical protein
MIRNVTFSVGKFILASTVFAVTAATTASDNTTTTTTTTTNENNSNNNYINRNSKSKSNSISCSSKIIKEGIPSADVKRSAIAARLNQLLYNLEGTTTSSDSDDEDDNGNNPYLELESYGFYSGTYYESGIDAAYTIHIKNNNEDEDNDDDNNNTQYCFVSYRGTSETSMKDWFSNLDTDPIEFSNSEDGDDNNNDNHNNCDMHKGYYDAYNFEYRQQIESFLDKCINECSRSSSSDDSPNNSCEVVLSGQSQGGAIAEIAGLYLKDRFPKNNSIPMYVITFGSPQALGAGCSNILTYEERCNWYHYIMTTDGLLGQEVVYDPIPMLYSQYFDTSSILNDTFATESTYARENGVAFIGHEIILASYDTSRTYYAGFDKHGISDITKIDTTGRAHQYDLYTDVVEKQYEQLYYANNNDDNNAVNNDDNNDANWASLPTTGFSIGSLCNKNENMCIIGSECKKANWYDWSTVCQPPSSMSSKIDNTNTTTMDTNISTISSISSSSSTYNESSSSSSSSSSSQNGSSSSSFFFYISSLSWIMMLSVS